MTKRATSARPSLKEEVKVRSKGVQEEARGPEFEGGGGKHKLRGDEAAVLANGDLGSRHRLDWTEDEDVAPGKGVIEKQHSTDVDSTSRVRASV